MKNNNDSEYNLYDQNDASYLFGADGGIDVFGAPTRFFSSLVKAVLATTLVRCWHILIFYAVWATAVSVISHNVVSLAVQPTLITVFGTVLGFVISYRTTSSFDRYNEGKKLWSQIILASRNLARAVWFHIPELLPPTPADAGRSEDERRARIVIEKKTILNLVEAFAVSVKHYLRGEEGIHYVDLYHLVKFLPSYALPAGMPHSAVDLANTNDYAVRAMVAQDAEEEQAISSGNTTARSSAPHLPMSPGGRSMKQQRASSATHLPLPNTTKSPTAPKSNNFLMPPPMPDYRRAHSNRTNRSRRTAGTSFDEDEPTLLPARMPPKYHLFDIFPFSLLVKLLTKKGKELKGKKAARYRARLKERNAAVVTHNVPLEISLYLTTYIAALTARKSIDVPSTNLIIASISQLTDALTGLERILTTPIPFSYSIHLWVVTSIYCLVLPFQIWGALKWLTIPATIIASFIYFGFLVAGEEIENPFGYDKNDLNMDHFTHNIIRNELLAVTARAPPDPADWAFSPQNDHLFVVSGTQEETDASIVPPEEWVKRGYTKIKSALEDY